MSKMMPRIIILILSLLLSLMMILAPLPEELLSANPSWCLLTLLFWTYGNPRLVNVGVAWGIGIIMDGLTGSLLGLHAFSFVIVVYLFDCFYRRFHMFHVLQQSLAIGILVAVNFIIILCVKHTLTANITVWSIMLGAGTSALCWPFYCFFGKKLNLMRG